MWEETDTTPSVEEEDSVTSMEVSLILEPLPREVRASNHQDSVEAPSVEHAACPHEEDSPEEAAEEEDHPGVRYPHLVQ